MTLRTLHYIALMTIAALTACVTADKGGDPRPRCLRLLETEMRSTANTNWVRIHAADALIEHFAYAGVYNEYLPQADITTPQYRIGVWRVLAGACPTAKQKGEFATRIRTAMLDENGPDRLHAVETVGKLNLGKVDEIPLLEKWAGSTDEATAAFVRWTIALASSPATRPENEVKLAALLGSSDPIVRLRAAFGLRRLPHISSDSLTRLEKLVQSEPADSIARAYIVTAAFFHTTEIKTSHAALKAQMLEYLATGKPNEILEIAPVIGKRGSAADLPVLLKLLDHPEPDGRIGGAQGALHLLAK